uniref:Oxysterol-binding protein-related protein 2A-like isoform X4 n=1 Tax=Rhizophora mucronata TaxID=61149 RepID=A0A2P2LXE8_RHIMU
MWPESGTSRTNQCVQRLPFLCHIQEMSADCTRSSLNSPNIFGHPSQFRCSLASQYPPTYLKGPFSSFCWNHMGFHPCS